MEEFIDLCILCGCDYTKSIGGIGPVKAFKFIKDCGNIENVLKKIDEDADDPKKKQKYIIPSEFKFKESRELFKSPEVITDKTTLEGLIKWTKPDEEALKAFLINEKGFTETKVESGLKKLSSAQTKVN
jgi:flap endonuclease-1